LSVNFFIIIFVETLKLKNMNEKLKNLKDKITTLFKNGIIYGIILCSIAASFFVGSFYNQMTNKNKSSKVQVRTIVKSEVNLAIDENNHLIVIDKKTGNYSIYQDSIGKTIFKLYAKNVWGQNNTVTTSTIK
jgi:hypothetical protein